jgi:hypothetical protein
MELHDFLLQLLAILIAAGLASGASCGDLYAGSSAAPAESDRAARSNS